MKKASEILKQIEEEKKDIEFIPTGFPNIDKDLDGGFIKKEIIVLGAFTGLGKSIFTGQIFYNIAKKGFQCGYYSLEISNQMIVSRLVGQLANIKPAVIMSGKQLEPEEIDNKAKAKADIIAYDESMNFSDNLYLLADIFKSIQEHKHEFVVIDFIQNILLDNNMDEYARLSFVSVQLQKFAKENNCCIMILSQLSNKVGREGAKITEYKGSGSIGMIADLGFFLERGEPILDINGQPVGNQEVKLFLKKNRRGISGLYWDLKFTHPGGKIV